MCRRHWVRISCMSSMRRDCQVPLCSSVTNRKLDQKGQGERAFCNLKLFARAEPVNETLTRRHTDAFTSLTEFLHSFHAHAGIHAHLVSSNQDESIGLHSYQASIWLDNTEKWHKVLKKYTCMHIASQFRLITDLFDQILSQSLSHDVHVCFEDCWLLSKSLKCFFVLPILTSND